MSRHQITVRSATDTSGDEALERRLQLAVAGAAALECESEVRSRGPRPLGELIVVGLREIEDALVVAEHQRQELRVAVELEGAHDERVEVPGKEVGEVERRRL